MAFIEHIRTKTSIAARVVAVLCTSLIIAGCVGYGIAAAGAGASEGSSFGLSAKEEAQDAAGQNSSDQADQGAQASDSDQSAQTSQANQNAQDNQDAADTNTLAASTNDTSAASVLASATTRDISRSISEIEAEEEAARIAAEEAKRAEEQARIEAAEKARAEQKAKAGQEAMASLSDVDWEVGEEAFLEEWTRRIDDYLAGSPLSGMGATFAKAAWENGVDPRWSPAISNTESTKGRFCFASHNAWGWGSSSWSTWEEAINAHVAGLARGYGYTISYDNAKKYCPPTYDSWFNSTLSEMKKI